MDRIAELVGLAKEPLILAGNGVRLAGEQERFERLIESSGIPFVTTWTGADLLPTDHPQNIGIVGMCGQPGANKAVDAAELLLVLGSHLSLPQIGNPPDSFAPYTIKIVVDIDQNQLDNMVVDVQHEVCASLADFFDQVTLRRHKNWAKEYKAENRMPMIGSYAFNDRMTRMLPEGTPIVIDGGGTALYTGFQSSYIKRGTRLICSSSMSAMGSGLPEAIGACLASGRRMTTCLIGDGSLMLNMQELQTIATHNLPIKIFVIENGGYLAIRHTQKQFQEGRYFGTQPPDLEFPRAARIADLFDIPAVDINWDRTLPEWILSSDGPTMCVVHCPEDQQMVRQKFIDGKPQPLTDMEIPA